MVVLHGLHGWLHGRWYSGHHGFDRRLAARARPAHHLAVACPLVDHPRCGGALQARRPRELGNALDDADLAQPRQRLLRRERLGDDLTVRLVIGARLAVGLGT